MSATPDIAPLPAPAKCYRLRRNYLLVSVVGGAFFAAIGVFSTLVAWFNIDGDDRFCSGLALSCRSDML